MDNTNDNKEEQKNRKRGFEEEDTRWFSKDAIVTLNKAQEEVKWLLNRGYKIASIIELVGGHYQLSARQRTALMRGTASTTRCINRIGNQLSFEEIRNTSLNIDGFNLIITLEVALSGGVLILGNDGVLRDLAGLRGTYRVIDKTEKALQCIAGILKEIQAQKVKFFLDAPVSNSGRLKMKIQEYFSKTNIEVEVELVPNPDKILINLENVVTGDSVILDECKSWFNLSRKIIEKYIKDAWVVDFNETNTELDQSITQLTT